MGSDQNNEHQYRYARYEPILEQIQQCKNYFDRFCLNYFEFVFWFVKSRPQKELVTLVLGCPF
jgi:hypothetical protein